MAAVSVCVVNVKDAYLSAVYGIKDILGYANGISRGAFEVTILDEEDFASSRKRFSFVVIPPFRPVLRPGAGVTNEPVVEALRRAIARGAIPVSVCAGAYYLCATGIADGKPVTTHWLLAEDLARRFPSVTVARERVLVDGDAYIAAGGITSFQDLSLHLIRRFISPKAALEVARVFLINPGDRTQLQYIRLVLENPRDDELVAGAKAYMNGHLAESLTLDSIASHCGVTARTLLRRFAASAAGTPAAYLFSARVAHARTLLESSDAPIKRVADDSGYGDLPAFIRAFRKATGVSPGEYRKRFRAS